MQKIKLIIGSIIVVLIIGLGITIYFQSQKIKQINSELSTSVINNKAYELENSELKDKAIQFELTIEQLNYSNDSLMQKLNDARKQLKIKDKNIKELQYIAATNFKRDSVYIKDTIFKEPNFQLDTLIGDKWASLHLNLKYPNELIADYEFNNETTIVTSSNKETIEPPKKCWLGRLFQKKHTVVTIDVIQGNPYCTNTTQRHVKILD